MSARKKSLRIGYLSTLYHTSLLIKAKNWLEEEGIETRWTLFGTGPAIIDSFAQKNIDIGYIGLAPTAIGIGKGRELKCIAGGHVEGTVIVAKKSYNPIDHYSGDMQATLSQFRGVKIGVPRKGSVHDVFLRHYFSECKLLDDIEIVNYDWADFIPEAMSEGEIDAAAGTPPLSVVLSRLTGAKIVIPPNLIWPNNPSYGIVTSNKMIEESRDLLEVFLTCHKRADCSVIRETPEEAAKAVSKAVGIIDEDFALETYRVSPKYCVSLSKEFVDSTIGLLTILKNLGYLTSSLDKKDIFDFNLVNKIHPESPHYSL